MPRKSEWLQHIPHALEQLNEFPAPVLDRSAVECLLRVQRRMAIRLMHRFGGYQAGRTFLIEKEHLHGQLLALLQSDDVQQERVRWVRFVDQLDRARSEHRSRQVVIPPPILDLQDNVRLERGKLEIRFESTVELLQSLLYLAQRISDDFEGIQRQIDPNTATLPTLL